MRRNIYPVKRDREMPEKRKAGANAPALGRVGNGGFYR
jgi:hypothetical protein